jgi:hypothetical protein
LNSILQKGEINTDYFDSNPFVARDMWEQMWGRTNLSWYKLGDKTLFLMTDSKSMTSFAYRLLPSWERSTFKLHGNTYQTYLWTETSTEIESKVLKKACFINQQNKKH